MAEGIVHLGIPNPKASPEVLRKDPCASQFGASQPVFSMNGKDVWLIDPPKECSCDSCKGPLTYLMQLYAPIDEYPEAYHRVLYVFYCGNSKCAKSGLKVLRAQCSESHPLYKPKEEMPKEPPKEPEAKEGEEEKKISPTPPTKEEEKKAKKKKHRKHKPKSGKVQGIDVFTEKAEVTKHYATRITQLLNAKKESDIPEDEKEDITALISGSKETKYEKELIQQYEKMDQELTLEEREALDAEIKGLEEVEKEKEKHKDHYFNLFQWVSLQTPNQILRYTRHYPGIEPLWYRKEGILSKSKLGKCKSCGGDLVFECQIMPQLFNYIPALANVDWATIIIYTFAFRITNKT